MIDVKKSALAVVSENGQLVGNLSASDLKEIGYDMGLYDKLFDSVGDFLRKKSGIGREMVFGFCIRFF